MLKIETKRGEQTCSWLLSNAEAVLKTKWYPKDALDIWSQNRSNSFSIPQAQRQCQLCEPVANIKRRDLGNGSGPEELRNKNNTVHMNNTFTVGNSGQQW